ncbi:MAG: FkbM family methyltransferase [Candidatus Parvarchaeota archaeon]
MGSFTGWAYSKKFEEYKNELSSSPECSDSKCIIQINGILMQLDLNSNQDLEFGHLWKHGTVYEPEMYPFIKNVLSECNNFADVGANSGYYTIMASKLIQGEVYAFEPNEYSYERLVNNISLNKLTNVRPFKIGLSDRRGSAIMYDSPSGDGTNTMIKIPKSPKSYSIKVDTLDNVLKDEKVDVIKVDVEGYEEEVLKGAIHHLDSVKFIFFELNRDILLYKKKNPYTLLQLLWGKGFSIYWMTNGPRLVLVRKLKDIEDIGTNLMAVKELPNNFKRYLIQKTL